MNDSTDDGTDIPDDSKTAPSTAENEQIIWSAGPNRQSACRYHCRDHARGFPVFWRLTLDRPDLAPVAIAGVYTRPRYGLTNERLRKSSRSLTRNGEEVELYRVENTNPTASLLYRLNGRGNVAVLSTDRSVGILTLRAIKNHESAPQHDP